MRKSAKKTDESLVREPAEPKVERRCSTGAGRTARTPAVHPCVACLCAARPLRLVLLPSAGGLRLDEEAHPRLAFTGQSFSRRSTQASMPSAFARSSNSAPSVATTWSDARWTVFSRMYTQGLYGHWNNAENAWDCPCRGSIFADGSVIHGPTRKALRPAKL